MNNEELREAKKVLKELKGDKWYLGDTTDRAIEIIREFDSYHELLDEDELDEMAVRQANEGGAVRVWCFLNGISSWNSDMGYILDGYGNARNCTQNDLIMALEDLINNNE